jgi:uncharacterized protein YcbX
MTGTVDALWRYPAKSMQGHRIDRVEIGTGGLPGDRGWAVRDEVRGGMRGAKKIGGLMQLVAHYDREPSTAEPVPPITITLPNGAEVRSGDPDVHRKLSEALDHDVTLWPLQPADDVDHYRRGAPDHDDVDAELRDVFGRTPDEPLPDLSILGDDLLAEIIEFESPRGSYFDAAPIHLVTDTTLATLQRLAPTSTVDVRRFRPNLVIRLQDGVRDDPFPEQRWIGRSLRVGDAVLGIFSACPRCVMVTRPVAELDQDRPLLRTIVREAAQHVGVYARVVRPGPVATGDPVVMD